MFCSLPLAEGLKTGSLVKVKVQKETKDGYICETSFGMLAVITDLHTGGECCFPSSVEQTTPHSEMGS